METAVVIISILLIAIVLLQSGKAESANIIQGGIMEKNVELNYLSADLLLYLDLHSLHCVPLFHLCKISRITPAF